MGFSDTEGVAEVVARKESSQRTTEAGFGSFRRVLGHLRQIVSDKLMTLATGSPVSQNTICKRRIYKSKSFTHLVAVSLPSLSVPSQHV